VQNQTRKIRIVYAGLLGVAQNVLEVSRNIDFRQIGVEFHVYGSGPQKNAIEGFISKHPDRGVFYHGTLSRKDIPDVLMGYDATIIPLTRHIYGALPSKIYESMAAGLPIFFSGEGEGAHIVVNNRIRWTNRPGVWLGLKENISTYAQLCDC